MPSTPLYPGVPGLSCETGLFYDRLGLISPVILKGKILLQQAWKEGGSWDQPVSESLATACPGLAEDLIDNLSLSVDRRIAAKLQIEQQIHISMNASESALGCCSIFCFR